MIARRLRLRLRLLSVAAAFAAAFAFGKGLFHFFGASAFVRAIWASVVRSVRLRRRERKRRNDAPS